MLGPCYDLLPKFKFYMRIQTPMRVTGCKQQGLCCVKIARASRDLLHRSLVCTPVCMYQLKLKLQAQFGMYFLTADEAVKAGNIAL